MGMSAGRLIACGVAKISDGNSAPAAYINYRTVSLPRNA